MKYLKRTSKFRQYWKSLVVICSLFLVFTGELIAQPLSAIVDPICTTKCCTSLPPACNCSAGVIASGGVPPYTYLMINGTQAYTTACVSGLCAGTFNFIIRDAANNQIVLPVTIPSTCCRLNCRDTSFCYSVPDTAIHLVKPKFTSAGGAGTGNGSDCLYDSIWSNPPLNYPIGTTVVVWYVLHNGIIDTCQQNVIRNPPSAYNISFTTSPAIVSGVINICNGQSITFNDNSTGITGLLWNFGNGYYSTNSTHTEPAWHYPPGTYFDTLTVYDACGVAHDTAFQVVVDSASGPDIFCISVVCPGDTVTYYTSANCTGYTWSVTGGAFLTPPSPTSDSATVVWGAGPTGTITLNVTGCTPALTCPVGTTKTINIVPATMPIAGDTIVCAGGYSCYQVECIPGNNHSWEVLPANAGTVTGNGTCQICIQWNPTFFGPVTIQLNYQNVLTGAGCNLPQTCTDKHGCGGTATITVDVRPIFGINGPSKVCPNTTAAPFNGMNLTNNTIAPGVTWKLVTPVPSTILFPNTAALNAYTWNNGTGIYQLTAYAPANIYCTDSATKSIEVVNMLTPNIITGPDTVCANVPTFYSVSPNMGGVTYSWNVVNGVIIGPSTGSSVSISWNPGGGTVSVTQVLSAAPFCSSLPSPTYTVNTWPNFPLPVVTSSSPNVCMNSIVTYSIPLPLISNATYTWSIVPATAGNILTANGGNTISIKWISAAITPIFVKLKISRCYEDSVMVPINLLPLPTVPNIVYSPASPCVNTPVSFSTTNPGPLWNWSFGDAGVSTIQNPTHTYTAGGNYTVQLYVTNASGCSDTAITLITVNDKPVVPIITGPDTVCVNSLASYGFSQPLFPGANYTWSLSNAPKGIISSSGNNFMNLKWTIPGVDTVKVRVQATCLDTTIRYVVHVIALPTPVISVVSPQCQNAAVNFTGSGGVTYAWSFTGGAANSTVIANPIVSYSLPGTYAVSLTVMNSAGCSNTTTSSITINPQPNAQINGPNGVCSFPATVTVTAVAAPGYTFSWTPAGAGSSITQTINTGTLFSCVVTNAFGCTKNSNSIYIDTIPCNVDTCIVSGNIDFTYTPPICLSQTYTKTTGVPLSGWTFGAGGSAGAISPVTANYPYPGIFPVTVSGAVIGTYPSGAACSTFVTKTKNVTIPFNGDFDFAYQCSGTGIMQVLFTNTSQYLGSAGSYNWQWFDVTTSTTISTNPFPPALTLSAGTHIINLNIFDPITGATCTKTKTINVPLPIVAAFTVTSPLCVGAPNTFTNTSFNIANQASMLFNNGNGGTSTASPASLPYASSGSFTSSLTVTDIYGCTSSTTKPVTVLPAGTGTITVGPPTCDSVSLTASGPGPFTWNIISPPPFPNNPAYIKTSGFYSVTGIGVGGCPYTFGPVQVTVKKSPIVTITGQTQYCKGEALNIKTSAAGVNYAWMRLPGTPVGTNSPNLNIIASVAGTFTYQVTVTAANGCTGVATYTVNVDPVPTSASIVASGPLTFCAGDSIKLSVSPQGFNYIWSKSPTPAIPAPFDTDSILWVTQSGTYSAIVQTINGCAYPAIAPVTVVVNPVPGANITGDTTVCEGETLTLTTTQVGGATYVWTGPSATGITNPFVKSSMQLFNAGVYNVVVTNVYGCTSIDSINVIVNPTPTPPFINSNPGGVLCEGQLYNIFVTSPSGPPIVYNWSTGQIGTNINAVLPGDYSVTATNQFGCSSASNIITIHPNPDLSCVPTGCYEFCNECDSVEIPGPFGLAYYNWEQLIGGIFVPYSASQNMQVLPPGGKFRLIGATAWGCADSTDTLNITFTDCCPIIEPVCVDTCTDFNQNSFQGFIPDPAAPNVGMITTNVGSQAGPTDFYLRTNDLPGASQLLAGDQYDGKWCCGEFCFDFKIFDDGLSSTVNVNPSFSIRNGTLGFRFTSSVTVNETSKWKRICAPIADCGLPPVSGAGTWIPLAGTVVGDWSTVLSNVTDLNFRVDYSTAIGETVGFDNICINSSTPNINAGNDTTICAGTVITLNVAGCTGTPTWYELQGNIWNFIGNNPIIDIQPTQSTCYIVTCCGVAACCCDTDTVCVTVNPHPILQWNSNYPTLCQNGNPITLDTAQILQFVGGNWIPLTGGTGVFSGIGVVGNIFTPGAPGVYSICYNYTDSLGCSATICNTINVIVCCDTSFHVDAGPDQTICQGGVAVLTATGCTGTPQWYQLGVEGLMPIGQGEIVDVMPQTSTCYVVICCISPTCCDTDTVCINVNPHPILRWVGHYPNLCNGAGPITLDSANIQQYVGGNWIPLSGGTGVFSGVGVVGNVFTPPGLGSYVITYTYTDSLGCSASVSITLNVIFCCNDSTHVDAGPDQTICIGNAAILTATNCTGTPQWYQLGVEGIIPIGQGGIVDVMPQISTCYIVICCNTPACCDTDTVCVNVEPLPILSWPNQFRTLCAGSAPFTIDLNIVFVSQNNIWVPLPSSGGTWTITGPFMFGNTFNPVTPGSYVITITYTSPNGCVSTITNSITVIPCVPCDTSFHVDAGPDQTICQGNAAILTATGCTGTPQWYQLGVEGLMPIGQGGIVDVMPQTSTCYVVICCISPTCCDTDTVCINVNPHPIIRWVGHYPNLCNGAGPITLDSANIQQYVGGNWIPLSGGTGVFSGVGVVGNVFTPPGLGSYVITYTYTDSLGCSASVSITLNVIFCCNDSTHVDAGPDQTICIGNAAILTATNCTGTPQWYQLGVEGIIPIGQGGIVDVMPQISTCYIVICCNTPACCDTDTVCVNVEPLPILSWPNQFRTLCAGSAPFTIDLNIVFVSQNNIWVPLPSSGGTWTITGPFMFGNTFNPVAPGSYVITIVYTSPNGCVSTITNSITVIPCVPCDTSFHVDAGPDQTICQGNAAILTATGCTGTPQWYQIGVEGLMPIGQGGIVDVMPQTSTCYVVICCYTPACCDTDTVCVNVNPHPIIRWVGHYPNLCNGAGPITLDSANIQQYVGGNWIPLSGGTGVFSGVGVVGNVFTPPGLGSYVITYTYTDSLGCSASVSITLNVIFCCNDSTHVDAGPDQTICIGNAAILTATNCTGTPQWYQLGVEGIIPIGQGGIVDVMPQISTCYIVICCNTPACCDTDTVCVNVEPLPILSWPNQFRTLCAGSAPFTIDLNIVFVSQNNIWVPLPSSGGTWTITGPFMFGNTFNPVTPGSYVITITYTSPNGCVSTITNSITVIPCVPCDTSFHVDAGPDQTICQGNAAILTATGCTGTPQWYQLGVEGLMPIGQGGIVDVMPQTSTCYVVICCISPTCCDTDTVCINVNPHPIIRWVGHYPNLCNGAGPITLDSANIQQYVGGNWVPLSGGTGVFSGIGVVGNVFTPPGLGSYVITYTYTDSLGCSASVSITLNVIFCCNDSTHVDAGPDQTICIGNAAILTATNCTGTPQWYQLGVEGIIPIGQGGIVDVMPQHSTCYIVICCNTPTCCDTDTVCINVEPLPFLSWPDQFPTLCAGSAPYTINLNNVFVSQNNTWVSLPASGGTWTITGPFMFGNTFNPVTPGSYVITITYTSANGCVSTITNSITVIPCVPCDTSFHVDAGPDQTICQGNAAILTATGCTGTPQWYQIGVEGLMPIGQGGIVDVMPQTSTCYVVICCITPTCCDTDTVCVNVEAPPVLSWPGSNDPICISASPIVLNPNDIFVDINQTWIMSTFAGGTGVFSGPGVVGNTFTPPGVGAYTICFTYTTQAGCSNTICKTYNIIICCDTSFHVDAGPDQTICQGNAAILTATGCTGTPQWYQLGVEGLMPIGQGGIVDVMPQTSTCYVVICCVTPTCCDTDTVCVIVEAPPVLSWPGSNDPICISASPIVLNPNDIFVDINQTWIMSTFAGGTGVFSGPGVVGNTFTPPGLGSYTICFTYTTQAGCSNTICKTYNIIFCCDTSFHVDAGPDKTICVGSSTNLTVSGCVGNATWYELNIEGLIPIGQGEGITVSPYQSTCYVVICCPTITCCDTDTVCVNVVPQGTSPQWMIGFASVCQNGAPVGLDAANIFYLNTNPWTSITSVPGSGYFSGPNVVGNYFYPTTLGWNTITYNYTDSNGCVYVLTNSINVTACGCGPCFRPGPEMLVNSGFEAGNTGFNSSLSYSCSCVNSSYCISSNAQGKCGSYLNLTSTSVPTGNNYMVIDGNTTVSLIWSQNVTILSSQTYTFSFWVHPSVASVGGQQPSLDIRVGATSVMNLPGSSLLPGWRKYSVQISGISGSSIEIHLAGFLPAGTAYGFDDMSLKACVRNINVNYNPVTHVSCFGHDDGSATANVTGGTQPYTYQWSSGETSEVIIDKVAGPYTLTVIDWNGCNYASTVTINQPDPILISGFTPTAGTAGTPVIISGTGFVNISEVAFNGVLSSGYTINNPTQISVNVPPAATSGPITVGSSPTCITSSTGIFNVTNGINLHVDVFIQGFYLGSGVMTPVLYNNGISTNPNDVDSIRIELHESVMPYGLVATAKGILKANGNLDVEFPPTLLNGDYYIVIKHRNSIETWSKYPVQLIDPTNYDFTH